MTHAREELSTALDRVLDRFAALVRSVGGRHGLSDVDEVMQEVRIRLWRARPSAESLEAVGSSYVYKTAVSAALDLLRRRRAHRAASTTSLAELTVPLVDAHDPARDLAARELAERVAAAVDAIPASRRPVVRLHLRGYSREEIAELFGWSEAKTRNLLYRGLADLRERLVAAGISPDAPEGTTDG